MLRDSKLELVGIRIQKITNNEIDIVDDTHNGNKILQQCSILQLQVATIKAKVKV